LWVILQFVGKVRDKDGSTRQQESCPTQRKEHEQPAPNILKLMSFPMFGAMLAAFMVEFCVGVWTPLIAPFVAHEFGGGSMYAGFVMAIPAVSYGLCGAVLPSLYPVLTRPKIIFTGLMVFGLGLFMMNPCHFYRPICSAYHLRVCILLFVQLIMGGASTFAFVPTLPLMLDSVKNVPGDSHGSVSGAWNAMVALGQVLGPLVAEELSKYADFATIMMVLGATTICVAFLVLFLTSSASKCPDQKEVPLSPASLQTDYGTLILNT